MQGPAPRADPPARRPRPAFALALVVALALVPFGVGAAHPAAGPDLVPLAGPSYVNITTTEQLGFSPNDVTVLAGTEVELVVTQAADFNHTFTLSPTANFTFPSSDSTTDLLAYFALHGPLVNLTLGSTPGTKAFANLSAPAVGTYEFVCLEPTHFGSGMYGFLHVVTATSSGSSAAFPWLEVTVLVVVVAVVVAAAFVLVGRRKK